AVVGVDEDGNNLVAITHADSTQANETTVTVRPLTGDVNGDYSFVIRACEYPAMENCSEPRTVTGTIEPFNDRPVGTSGGVVAEAVEGAEDGPGATPVVFTIHGADPSDAGWSGYQGGTASYRLTSAPEVGE